jgi:nucleoid DNA-binding protein
MNMNKEQIARRLAKESRITPAAAADQLDRVVHDILKRVRNGQSASFPGLGTFLAGRKNGFQFDTTHQSGMDQSKSKKASK